MGIIIRHAQGSRVLKKRVQVRCLGSPVTSILPSNSWAGEACFIIGGGPSLDGFDWSQLDGYHVIGINKAFVYYPEAEVNFVGDYTFFESLEYSTNSHHPYHEIHQKWREYAGVKVFVRHDIQHRFVPGVYYVDEISQKAISYDLDRGIYPGEHSGLGALLFAVALGCKRIGLLGYDFKVQGSKTHFHDGYCKQDIINLEKNLRKFCRSVDEWAGGLAGQGIEVYNLSSDSELQHYVRCSVSAFLEMAV